MLSFRSGLQIRTTTPAAAPAAAAVRGDDGEPAKNSRYSPSMLDVRRRMQAVRDSGERGERGAGAAGRVAGRPGVATSPMWQQHSGISPQLEGQRRFEETASIQSDEVGSEMSEDSREYTDGSDSPQNQLGGRGSTARGSTKSEQSWSANGPYDLRFNTAPNRRHQSGKTSRSGSNQRQHQEVRFGQTQQLAARNAWKERQVAAPDNARQVFMGASQPRPSPIRRTRRASDDDYIGRDSKYNHAFASSLDHSSQHLHASAHSDFDSIEQDDFVPSQRAFPLDAQPSSEPSASKSPFQLHSNFTANDIPTILQTVHAAVKRNQPPQYIAATQRGILFKLFNRFHGRRHGDFASTVVKRLMERRGRLVSYVRELERCNLGLRAVLKRLPKFEHVGHSIERRMSDVAAARSGKSGALDPPQKHDARYSYRNASSAAAAGSPTSAPRLIAQLGHLPFHPSTHFLLEEALTTHVGELERINEAYVVICRDYMSSLQQLETPKKTQPSQGAQRVALLGSSNVQPNQIVAGSSRSTSHPNSEPMNELKRKQLRAPHTIRQSRLVSAPRVDATHYILLPPNDSRSVQEARTPRDAGSLSPTQRSLFRSGITASSRRVSKPSNVAHNMHVTVDPDTGDFVGLPQDWSQKLGGATISDTADAAVRIAHVTSYQNSSTQQSSGRESNLELEFQDAGYGSAVLKPNAPSRQSSVAAFFRGRYSNVAEIAKESRQQRLRQLAQSSMDPPLLVETRPTSKQFGGVHNTAQYFQSALTSASTAQTGKYAPTAAGVSVPTVQHTDEHSASDNFGQANPPSSSMVLSDRDLHERGMGSARDFATEPVQNVVANEAPAPSKASLSFDKAATADSVTKGVDSLSSAAPPTTSTNFDLQAFVQQQAMMMQTLMMTKLLEARAPDSQERQAENAATANRMMHQLQLLSQMIQQQQQLMEATARTLSNLQHPDQLQRPSSSSNDESVGSTNADSDQYPTRSIEKSAQGSQSATSHPLQEQAQKVTVANNSRAEYQSAENSNDQSLSSLSTSLSDGSSIVTDICQSKSGVKQQWTSKPKLRPMPPSLQEPAGVAPPGAPFGPPLTMRPLSVNRDAEAGSVCAADSAPSSSTSSESDSTPASPGPIRRRRETLVQRRRRLLREAGKRQEAKSSGRSMTPDGESRAEEEPRAEKGGLSLQRGLSKTTSASQPISIVASEAPRPLGEAKLSYERKVEQGIACSPVEKTTSPPSRTRRKSSLLAESRRELASSRRTLAEYARRYSFPSLAEATSFSAESDSRAKVTVLPNQFKTQKTAASAPRGEACPDIAIGSEPSVEIADPEQCHEESKTNTMPTISRKKILEEKAAVQISKPTSVRRMSHVSVDPITGKFVGLPPDLARRYAAASGGSEKELSKIALGNDAEPTPSPARHVLVPSAPAGSSQSATSIASDIHRLERDEEEDEDAVAAALRFLAKPSAAMQLLQKKQPAEKLNPAISPGGESTASVPQQPALRDHLDSTLSLPPPPDELHPAFLGKVGDKDLPPRFTFSFFQDDDGDSGGTFSPGTQSFENPQAAPDGSKSQQAFLPMFSVVGDAASQTPLFEPVATNSRRFLCKAAPGVALRASPTFSDVCTAVEGPCLGQVVESTGPTVFSGDGMEWIPVCTSSFLVGSVEAEEKHFSDGQKHRAGDTSATKPSFTHTDTLARRSDLGGEGSRVQDESGSESTHSQSSASERLRHEALKRGENSSSENSRDDPLVVASSSHNADNSFNTSSTSEVQKASKRSLSMSSSCSTVSSIGRSQHHIANVRSPSDASSTETITALREVQRASSSDTDSDSIDVADSGRQSPLLVPPPPSTSSSDELPPPPPSRSSANHNQNQTSTPLVAPPLPVNHGLNTEPKTGQSLNFDEQRNVQSASRPPPPPAPPPVHSALAKTVPPPPISTANANRTQAESKRSHKNRPMHQSVGSHCAGDLLSSIKKGKRLRKVTTVDKSKPRFAADTSTSSRGNESAEPPSAGGLMSQMLAARRNLGKKGGARQPRKRVQTRALRANLAQESKLRLPVSESKRGSLPTVGLKHPAEHNSTPRQTPKKKQLLVDDDDSDDTHPAPSQEQGDSSLAPSKFSELDGTNPAGELGIDDVSVPTGASVCSVVSDPPPPTPRRRTSASESLTSAHGPAAEAIQQAAKLVVPSKISRGSDNGSVRSDESSNSEPPPPVPRRRKSTVVLPVATHVRTTNVVSKADDGMVNAGQHAATESASAPDVADFDDFEAPPPVPRRRKSASVPRIAADAGISEAIGVSGTAVTPEATQGAPMGSEPDSDSDAEPVDPALAAMQFLPEGNVVEVSLSAGPMGCVMADREMNDVTVVYIDEVKPVAQDGLCIGDIVLSVNGETCIDRGMEHFAKAVGDSDVPRTLSLLRPAGSVQQVRDDGLADEASSSDDSGSSEPPPPVPRRRKSTSVSPVATRAIGSNAIGATQSAPMDSESASDSDAEPVDPALAAMQFLPEGNVVEVSLSAGPMGCVMAEHEVNDVTVVYIDEVKPVVQDGLCIGDIVLSVNGETCIDRGMEHFAKAVGDSSVPRTLSLLRPAGSVQQVRDDGLADEASSSDDSGSSEPPPPVPRRRKSTSVSPVATRAIGSKAIGATQSAPMVSESASDSDAEPVDPALAAMQFLPEGNVVEVSLSAGPMGCVMAEHEVNDVTVVYIDEVKPVAQDGLCIGDIVMSVNGETCIDRGMEHFAKAVGDSSVPRTLSLLRPAGSVQQVRDDGLADEASSSDDSGSSEPPPPVPRRRKSTSVSPVATRAIGSKAIGATQSAPMVSESASDSDAEPVDPALAAMQFLPEGNVVEVSLSAGPMGCVMAEHEVNDVTVVYIDEVKPVVQDGLCIGDIVLSVNGETCIDRGMEHFAKAVGDSSVPRTLSLLRPAGSVQQVRDDGLADEASSSDDSGSSEPPPPVPRRRKSTSVSPVATRAIGSKAIGATQSAPMVSESVSDSDSEPVDPALAAMHEASSSDDSGSWEPPPPPTNRTVKQRRGKPSADVERV